VAISSVALPVIAVVALLTRRRVRKVIVRAVRWRSKEDSKEDSKEGVGEES
jgi:hypothetical protein